MIGVTILGSTGSIGKSTLDVLRMHPERFQVVALTANANAHELLQLCLEFFPKYAVLSDPEAADGIRQQFQQSCPDTELLAGTEALEMVAQLPEVQYVMAAIVGAAGLLPTIAAAKSGKRILLANKESLVVAGRLLLDEAKQNDAMILPIDSEHNAVFQCLPTDFGRGLHDVGVRRILLTASGGPFRTTPVEDLKTVSPQQACAHPNWDMGRKISVDSATMMNKGLELIEACLLFNATPDQVQVVLHPQSMIHSLVEYCDGSTLAQLGNPDMRTPIAHALAWPDRIESGVAGLDLIAMSRFDFEPPDEGRFPCLGLAYKAAREGGSLPAILNAANEIAVEAFLDGRIPFTTISEVNAAVMNQVDVIDTFSLEQVLQIDRDVRVLAREFINNLDVSEA